MSSSKINYKNLDEVIVTSQKELDRIPKWFEGRIIIDAPKKIICVKRDYKYPIKAVGDSFVRVKKRGKIDAYDRCIVEAYDYSGVCAYDNSCVNAFHNSYICMYGNSYVSAMHEAKIYAQHHSSVFARQRCEVTVSGSCTVEAYDECSVTAYGNTSITAYDLCTVIACNNSSVTAFGNVQIQNLQNTNINMKVSGNARILHEPQKIEEIMELQGIRHTTKKAKFYKAVHCKNGRYFSNYNYNFEYKIGETACSQVNSESTNGIFLSTLVDALQYGREWEDLAILEMETDINQIVMPCISNGDLRTPKVKVMREVPLEECGILGKMIIQIKKCQNEKNMLF